MPDWFVAKVKPKNEHKVEVFLGSLSAEVYNPSIVVSRNGREAMEPLFPGYVFIKATPASREWPIIRWAPGLAYFLPNRDNPSPVSPTLVSDIVERVEDWNGGGWIAAFQPGKKVRVAVGPLRSLDAVFSRYLPGRQRCEVLVSLLGRLQTVTLDIRSLEHPIASPRARA